MALVNKFLDLLKCRIRFCTPEGKYEGVIVQVVPSAETIVVGKLILLPDCRMGALNFRFDELSNIEVINRPITPKESVIDKKDVSPVYPKTQIEKLFDFDGNSDIEDDDDRHAEYALKLVPHLSRFVPRDYEIIECFNRDFNLAIKHIMKQNEIGVSLEGVKIGRSGTLTWLCISTPCCNFLFDILALGEMAFKKGLQAILENANIQKIIHDCRLPSDCLYHKYGVRLVNVFDTQVADFIVMMQMCKTQKIINKVNTLDACLQYYLEVPYDYLYGQANFEANEDSLNFHALRPLHHEIQDVLIKNVMYLHLLKRELELAMQTPLRRATDVYLNSVQKLEERELLIVKHKPDELPPDIHLEGIQIFRYQEFEYFCNTVSSGPPYRKISNPMKEYLIYRSEYKDGQRGDKNSFLNKHSIQDDEVMSSELSHKASKSSSQLGLLGDRVRSSDRLCESGQESPNDCKKNQTEEHLKKNPSSRFGNGCHTVESVLNSKTPSRKCKINNGLLELLAKSRGTMGNVKSTSEQSSHMSKCSSEISVENINVDEKSVGSPSCKPGGLANLKFSDNRFIKDNMSKAKTSRLHHPSEESQVSRMPSINALKTDTSSDEGFKKTDNVKTFQNTDPVQINNSVGKDYESISDSDFEKITARGKGRGAALHSHLYKPGGLANLKFSDNHFIKDNMSTAKSSQFRHPREESQVSRNALKTDTSSDEGYKKTDNLKTFQNTDPVQIKNSVVRDYQDVSDSELEEIKARVKARGAALRNRETDVSANDSSSACSTFSQNVKFNPKKTACTSSDDLKPTSEDVTIYYSDVLGNPTKFNVKVSHNSCRLEDLYKKAGDFNLLWSEEDSNGISNSSPNQHPTLENTEDFWALIRADLPCKPMNEKQKIRFIPAGMAGY